MKEKFDSAWFEREPDLPHALKEAYKDAGGREMAWLAAASLETQELVEIALGFRLTYPFMVLSNLFTFAEGSLNTPLGKMNKLISADVTSAQRKLETLFYLNSIDNAREITGRRSYLEISRKINSFFARMAAEEGVFFWLSRK